MNKYRKGHTAINALGCVDAFGRILYWNCRFPGSCADSLIYNNSLLRVFFFYKLKNLFPLSRLLWSKVMRRLAAFWSRTRVLLIPLPSWLLIGLFTPPFSVQYSILHSNPALRNQKRFNALHARTRVIVERTFAFLKSRYAEQWK